ncbi:MAG: shikimate dehydrogenase [Syntrophales bacterium]|nr:shikimate dehydrogenase [Syntrophales bacterium]
MKKTQEKLFCLIGNPVSHSLSPVMHRAAFEAIHFHACYHAFLVSDLAGAIKGIRSLGISGVSVTIPFKEAVIPYLDNIDENVRRIGAANTILNQEGQLVGFNTDSQGFMRALRRVENPKGKKVIVLGAGGAARAIVYALVTQGAQVTILNRTREKGEKLAQEFSCSFASWEQKDTIEGDMIVNTTPVGMYPHTDETPVDASHLSRFNLVVDIIYHPVETKLIRLAHHAGLKTLSGVDMFIYQGAEQFRLWTGLEPPIEVMHQAVMEALKDEA